MAVQPIVQLSASPGVLRRVSEPVREGVGSVQGLVADLKDTLLEHANGVGLAAPQVGVHQRVIVVRLGGDAERRPGPPIPIINPEILDAADARPDFDGCLSIPGIYGETVRPHSLRLRGVGERGETLDWKLQGFDAVIVHHEVDHLDGILFIDRVTGPEKLFAEAPDRASGVDESASRAPRGGRR